MSIDLAYSDRIDANLQRWAENPPPPAEQGFSMTSFLGAGLKAVPAAVLEMSGGALDATSGYGNIMAASGGSARGMFALPDEGERKQEAEARARMLAGDNANVATGNVLRKKAEDLAPDPITANRADQVIFGLTRFAGKAVGYVGTMGPLGAIPLGLEEGNTVTQNLREKGIDTETAAKVGAVQGVTSALGAVMPLGGKTLAQTIGLVGAGGPGMYMAQESTSREILARAGYKDEASLHNPFDPLGLTLSTVIPGAFGAMHMRGVAARKADVAGGKMPLAQMSGDELRGLKYNDPRLDAYTAQVAEQAGVPPAILLGIKNAGEKSGPMAKSPAGALGVMQFMEATAKEMGLKDRTDPLESIQKGAEYLRKLHDAYGSWDAAIAHYNGGGAQAAIVRGGGKPTIPETAAYLDRVLKYAGDHAVEAGSKVPEVVDAARVSVLNDTIQRSLPDVPDAYERVLRAGDAVAEGAPVRETAAIPRADMLNPLDRGIEDRFANKLADDFTTAVDEYAQRPDSMGGKVLNTDIARELSPDYLADRTRSAAVHEPASWFVKQLYERKLADLQPGQRVVFTSGGTGAGKTTAIQSVEAARMLQDGAAMVYDTNMNSLASAASKIDKALAAGAEVQIVHVQRDPVDALVHGSLPRAMRQEGEFGSGRTVPLEEHARTHVGAADVIQQLADRYAGNPNVHIHVIDNTGGKGGAQLADLGFVRNFDYTDVEGKLHAALQQEFQAGRISEAVYRGSGVGQGLGPQARRVDGAGPARDFQGAASPDFGEVERAASPNGEQGTPDLHAQIADRLAKEQPDLLVRLPGSDENIKLSDALKRIAEEQKQDGQWADLVKVAADCALTAG